MLYGGPTWYNVDICLTALRYILQAAVIDLIRVGVPGEFMSGGWSGKTCSRVLPFGA